MTYTKTNWQAGDTITAAKLNNLENGVEAASGGGSGIMVVEMNKNNVPNYSYAEIAAHVANGGYAYFNLDGTIYNLSIVVPAEGATVGEIRFESNYVDIDDDTGPTYAMWIEKATITSENPNYVTLTSYSVPVNQG